MAAPVNRSLRSRLPELLIILLGAALSIVDLAGQSLWTDEGMAYWVARLRVPEQVALLRETAPNPLHYLMLGGWMKATGASEFALRFLSVLGATLAIALIYRVGRDLAGSGTPGARRAAQIAALLFAINPMRIYYAQEARAYAWLVALVLGCAVLLWRSRRGLSAIEIIALGLLQALTCLAHPYAAFTLLALNAVIFAHFLLRGPRGGLVRWALASALAAVLAGVWFFGAAGAIAGSAGSGIYFRGRLPALQIAWDALQSYAGGLWRMAPGAGAALLALALAGGILGLLRGPRRWTWLFLLAGCVAPVAGILLLSGDREHYAPRYVIPGVAFFCLLVGQFACLPALRRRAARIAYGVLVTALAALMLFGTWRQFVEPGLARPDFRSVSRYILAHGDPGTDAVVVVGGHFAPVMRYYLDRAGYDLYPMPPGIIQNVDHPLQYEDLSILNDAVARHGRVWLALWQRELADPGGIVLDELLSRARREEVSGEFGDISLLLFDVPPQTTFDTNPQPAHPASFVWGDRLALEGFDMAPGETVRPGESIDLTLHWRPLAPIGKDYLASAQLIGPDGKLYGQADHMAHSDFYPSSLWRVGAPVLDHYRLAVPPGTPPGEYSVNVVLYDRDGERWLTGGKEVARLAGIRVGP